MDKEGRLWLEEEEVAVSYFRAGCRGELWANQHCLGENTQIYVPIQVPFTRGYCPKYRVELKSLFPENGLFSILLVVRILFFVV